MRDPAQYGSQALSTISTNMSLREMKCCEEDTPTTTTRVVTTKITTEIKMDTMVKRIGTKHQKFLPEEG